MIRVKIKKLRDEAIIPSYSHDGDSCVDLYSIEEAVLNPLSRRLIHTGLSMAIPKGYEGLIRPRSGNALKRGITVLNTPGTIDSNYRGEIGVILYNATRDQIYIHEGDRIAQMAFKEVPKVEFDICDELDDTNRGVGGFGSTGF